MLSDPGRVRRNNEDTCAFAPELGAYVVCDGMGGAAAGEIASRLAATTFLDQLAGTGDTAAVNGTARARPPTRPPARPQARLQAALAATNRAVHQRSLAFPELAGMGTTLIALLHVEPPEDRRVLPRTPPRLMTPPDLFLLNVGDSRCYRLREAHLVQLSTDHSFVEEQVRAGQITAEEAATSPMRSYITRAIGPSREVEADLDSYRTQPGDLYLLCSDGLSRELTTEQMAALLTEDAPARPLSATDLQSLLAKLIDAANRQGGHDNITALLVACP